MSFLNKLGKGFVRSMVNQVGRDGGKVVSNKIYGDAHSTPVRMVRSSGSSLNESVVVSGENVGLRAFGAFMVCVFLPLIGTLVVLWRSYVNYQRFLHKKEYNGFKIEGKSVYKSDLRFKSGARYIGYQDVKVPVVVEMTEKLRRGYREKAILYLIMSIIGILMFVLIQVSG
jgi:hypothetical protein